MMQQKRAVDIISFRFLMSRYSSLLGVRFFCYVFILHHMVKAGWSLYHPQSRMKSEAEGLPGVILMCICQAKGLESP